MQPLNNLLRRVAVLAIFVGTVGIGVALWDVLRAPATITILTKPLDELEEHGHKTERGDSLESKGHVEGVISDTVRVKYDTWVTGMEIVTRNAPQSVVHHMHLFAPERKDAYCTVMPEILMDVGQDAIPYGDFPKGYGIFLPKGTVVQVNAALHNPDPPLGTGDDYHDVSVGFTLRIDRFGSFKDLKPLSLHIISLADKNICNATTFTIPPHTTGYETVSSDDKNSGSKIEIRRSGTVVAMGAHIHAWEGGENLRVYKNGVLVHTFLPEKVSTVPDVWRTMPYYMPVRVEKGDVLTTSATYSNPYDLPITGAMGMAAFFINYDE